MLILSRRKNQRVRIADDIWVEVLTTGKTVKLGFTAPSGFVILREELVGVPRPHFNITPSDAPAFEHSIELPAVAT